MLGPLLLSSATSLAAAIRRREVTSRAVVEAHIARIQAVNPVINAIVDLTVAAALELERVFGGWAPPM